MRYHIFLLIVTQIFFSGAAESLHFPIDNFESGGSLKPFGKYVSPSNSPVQPEKFQGYHTAVDVEIAKDQQDKDIPVYAISDCEIELALFVDGYGGTMVLSCEMEGRIYSVLYGHLDTKSFTHVVGDFVGKGEKLAILGEGYSQETDGERMHLHFAMQHGEDFDLRGYVQSREDLSAWIDPMEFFEEF